MSQAEAEPVTSVKVGDVASATWSGPSLGATSNPFGGGSVTSIGDINDDGVSDVAVMGAASVAILFTPRSGHGGDLPVANLPAERGYVVSTPGTMTSIANIGDQNGDGVPDLAIGDGVIWERVIVVYGVADPSGLPICSSGTSKCLDASNPSTMPLSTGYVLDTPTSGDGDTFFGISVAGVGGLTGSGSIDFAIGASTAMVNGAVYVVKGSFEPTSSPVDITALPPADVLTIEGSQPGGFAGTAVSDLGDMNGDGLGDLYIDEPSLAGADPGRGYVLHGGSDLANPVDLAVFDGSQGFMVAPPLLASMAATNAGDVNGDGRADLALGGYGLASTSGSAAVLYGPASSPEAPVSVATPTADQGYAINPGDTGGLFGTPVINAGDMNGDGIPDQLFAGRETTVGGNAKAGAASFVFGQRPSPDAPLTLGPTLTPDIGVAVVGQGVNNRLGSGLDSLGDVDGDGLPDYALAAPGAQKLYLVLGSSLIGQAKTGQAGSVRTVAATLGGFGVTNGRDSTAYFEYGVSDEYGQVTANQAIGRSPAGRGFDAEVSGLTPDTEYHYRAVVVNDLGLEAFGADRTFKTAAVPVDRCAADPTVTPGCDGFNFCKANPSEPGCKPPVMSAGLSSLIARSNLTRVRRGGSTQVTTWITSTGNAPATGVRVCIKVPRGVSAPGSRCRNVGQILPGRTASVKFKIRVKRNARRGTRPKIKFTASGTGVPNRNAQTRIRVTR